VISNDLKWPFYLKFCFAQVRLEFLREFRKQLHKNNKGRPTLSATAMFSMDFNFWRCKVYVNIRRVLRFFIKISVRPACAWVHMSFCFFSEILKIAILWHGPFQIRWRGARCSKKQWWLRKLMNFASRGFSCYLHGFLVIYPTVMEATYKILESSFELLEYLTQG